LSARSFSNYSEAMSNEQLLREDQDLAYRMSLEADRVKAAERQKIAEEGRLKLKLANQREAENSKLLQERLDNLAKLKQELQPEPEIMGGNVVALSIQFTGKKRVVRRFSMNSLIQVRFLLRIQLIMS